MSADDQAFLDVLSALPNDIRRYSGEVADYLDKSVDKLSDSIRDTLASTTWLPDAIRPSRPPPAPPHMQVLAVPATVLERVQSWVWRHKILTGVLVLASGAAVYCANRSSKLGRRTRRARRAPSGGRLEVVVVAGSPTQPLTRSLALDLERKGFVVFVVCNTIEDEVAVQNMSRPDIRPLTIDITDPPNAGASIERFAHYLQTPHAAVPNAKRHHLVLKAVVLIPSLNYQTSPIATIPPSSFADLFNTHLLHPILTIQAFLPMLTARLHPTSDKTNTTATTTPKVLVFTPSIISSINPPFHAPEATVCSALSAFTDVLAAELRPLGIPVTHVQLGTFDFSGFTPAAGGSSGGRRKIMAWPEPARHVYERNYLSHAGSAIGAGRIRGMRGSSLRELHNAVFDVLDGSVASGGGVVRVGLGAGVYGFVGRWVPRTLVAWMMGIRRVEELAAWRSSPSSPSGSNSHSPRLIGSEGAASSSSSSSSQQDFVAVPMGSASDSHVWKET